jgi:hypothetical protein
MSKNGWEKATKKRIRILSFLDFNKKGEVD